MLKIAKLGMTTAAEYFEGEYANASSAYFSEKGKAAGVWYGPLADELSLTGSVTKEAYLSLVNAQHPETREQLVQFRDTYLTREGKEAEHTAAWDFQLSVPKSWSLVALVGGDERLVQAAQDANREALRVYTDYVQARGGGNAPPITTNKWAIATFQHDTSRPETKTLEDGGRQLKHEYPSPQLHFHNIGFNLVKEHETNPEGKYRSLSTFELYKVSSLITETFRNELLKKGRELGYEIRVDPTTKAPEIKGISREYIEAESLRSKVIKDKLEVSGFDKGRARQIVELQTRNKKLNITPEDLRALWKQHGEVFDNQARKTFEQALARDPLESKPVTVERAVDYATKRLIERSAVIEHYMVVRDAIHRSHGTLNISQVEAEIARRVGDGTLLKTEHYREHAPAARYTTPEMVALEKDTVSRVLAVRNTVEPIVAAIDFSQHPQLKDNEPRQKIAAGILTARDQVIGLNGTAGSAKTTLAGILAPIAEQAGYQVKGLAPTGTARDSLQEKGINSETLQLHIVRNRNPEAGTAHQKTLYVVDEASLASTRTMNEFLRTLRPQDHVILVGDDASDKRKVGQHTSIEAGRVFQLLQDGGMKTAQLNKIYRQKDPEVKEIVQAFRHGRTGKAVELLAQQDRIEERPGRQERYQAIANSYAASPQGTLVVSPDNQSVQDISTTIRKTLQDRGLLAPDSFELASLVSRDVTGAERSWAGAYKQGDTVFYRNANAGLQVEKGSYATVSDRNTQQNLLTVRFADGRELTYDPAQASGVSVYATRIRPFAVGDRVQFTSKFKEQGVSTRDTGTVKSLDEHGNVKVALDRNSRAIGWNLHQFRHLDHAYVMTSHSAQSKTVERCLLHIETMDSRLRALLNQVFAYVAGSRPEHDLRVFSDDASRLQRVLGRENEEQKALSPGQIKEFALASAHAPDISVKKEQKAEIGIAV
jgi:conjugative relaxase-like TrwC/TraI family protein